MPCLTARRMSQAQLTYCQHNAGTAVQNVNHKRSVEMSETGFYGLVFLLYEDGTPAFLARNVSLCAAKYRVRPCKMPLLAVRNAAVSARICVLLPALCVCRSCTLSVVNSHEPDNLIVTFARILRRFSAWAFFILKITYSQTFVLNQNVAVFHNIVAFCRRCNVLSFTACLILKLCVIK